MGTLFGLSYSGWTEKARWALDHHGVRYRYVEHLPMLGELVIRAAARRPSGRVTVPLYLDHGEALGDSFVIAQRAERDGHGAPLFPASAREAIERWNATSERMLSAGRSRVVPRLLGDEAAMREQLPGWVPGFAVGAMLPTARVATRFLARKHGLDVRGAGAIELATIREGLDALRAGLARAGTSGWLEGGAFSYADVAMAVALQVVSPVADEFIPLGEVTRRAWTEPELAREYPDVVAWRDRVYRAKRRGG